MAIWPLVQLGGMSLHEVTAATLNRDWTFLGFENYRLIFADPDFWGVVGNTLVFVVLVTAIGMMVFIWALPPVIDGSIWKFLLADHGLVNELLRLTGIAPGGIGFLFHPQFALWSVALVRVYNVSRDEWGPRIRIPLAPPCEGC